MQGFILVCASGETSKAAEEPLKDKASESYQVLTRYLFRTSNSQFDMLLKK